jgi:CheY-like chemotaxis protein
MIHSFPSLTILSAEDDPDYRKLVQEAFLEIGQENTLLFVQDGDELLQYLRCQGGYSEPGQAPKPDLILLDLNMPHKDGRQSLAVIKADPDLRHIPVVVLTASKLEEDILYTYTLGGAGYIIKPETYQGLVEVVKGLNQYWFEVVELADGEHKNRMMKSYSQPHPGEAI